MPGGGQYEPQDSRNVTAAPAGQNPDPSWREREDSSAARGEYEPRDSRNVTGQPSQQDDRWRKDESEPQQADGEPAEGSREAVGAPPQEGETGS